MLTAVEYLRRRSELTKHDGSVCRLDCSHCKLYLSNNGRGVPCGEFECMFPEEAVKKIEEWWKEEEEKERNKIHFTPELLTALKGRMAEGSTWMHIVSENHFVFYSKPPVRTYPVLIFESVGVQEVWTESFPIYKEMVEKLFRQNVKVVALKNFVKGEAEENV